MTMITSVTASRRCLRRSNLGVLVSGIVVDDRMHCFLLGYPGIEWIENHPRFVFHFTPTSASWLNAVESFFAKLTKKRLKRGVFRSLQELKDAIHRFLDDTNADPKPFTWTKDPTKLSPPSNEGTKC